MIDQFDAALNRIGYILHTRSSNNILVYRVADSALLESNAKAECGVYDGYAWFASIYCEYLVIVYSSHDIIFALASSKDPTEVGPHDTPANYIASQLIGMLPSGSLGRMLVARGIWKNGDENFANRLNISTTNPVETSLTGYIEYVKQPKARFKVVWGGKSFRPVTILDSAQLLSIELAEYMKDPASVSKLEIAVAQAFPLGFSSISDSNDSKDIDTIQNYYAIYARSGSDFETLQELLNISFHLNWSQSERKQEHIDNELKYSLALKQKSRLEYLEKREQRLQHSLELLHKCHPSNKYILEWRVNNIYSNTIRYSPLYLSWKAKLESFIAKEEQWEYWLFNRLRELDWNVLVQNGIASVDEAEKLIKLGNIDSGSALTRMRVVVEGIVKLLHSRELPNQRPSNLNAMIREIQSIGVIPQIISVSLHTLRQAGNAGAHGNPTKTKDVVALLPLFVRVVEWFLQYESRIEK